MVSPDVVVHITDELGPQVDVEGVARREGLDYLAYSAPHYAARTIAHTHGDGRLLCIVTDLELRWPAPHPGRDKRLGMAFVNRLRGSSSVPGELFDAVIYHLVQSMDAMNSLDPQERQREGRGWREFAGLLLRRAGDGTGPPADRPGPRCDAPVIVYSDHAEDDDVREHLGPLDGVTLIPKGSEGLERIARAFRELREPAWSERAPSMAGCGSG